MNRHKLTCLLFVFCITTNCKKDDGANQVSSALQIAPVSIGQTYNTTTNLIGNVNRFIGFGETIDVGLPTEHISPAFEYITKIDAKVRSTSYGVVSNINYQDDTQDYELHITLNQNTAYLIIYDHVKNLEVEQGDYVNPGDILGIVGNWSETLGRTELQINLGNTHICPLQLGNDVFNNDHLRLLNALNTNSLTILATPCVVDELSN